MKKIVSISMLFCNMMLNAIPVPDDIDKIVSKSSAISKMPLVFFEGNIGAGKSTFLEILRKYFPKLVLTLEPCDEWQNVDGFNLLQAFYQDPTAWALIFQIYASMTRLRKQEQEGKFSNRIQFMERSWWTDRNCFAQMLRTSEKITALQWKIYEQMWDWYMRNSDLPIAFIYLRVEPETCLERLKIRSRSEEVGITLDYLQALHNCHESLLISKTADIHIKNIPVLVLDGSLNFKDDEQVQQDFVRQILDFLKIHGNIDLKDLCILQ